ncbi:MAG: GGDEF domain-containing protein [Armatimonadota bacterium]|nr:GGDEF domain-containing protein [Armatimonadota bacterium]
MMKVRDLVQNRLCLTWLTPQQTVKMAVTLLSRDEDVLPVREGDQVVGIVTARHLLGIAEGTPVSEVMSTDVLLLAPDIPVREAAQKMAQHRAEVAFVVMEEQIGIVRAIDLIPEVSRSYDPLTQLPWQDALREWSIEQLRAGREISILFFDIDNFGLFNKKYDHVTGDRVLQAVARTVERELDPDLTILCRYGGDEFAVATLFMIDEAQQLAARIARRVEEVDLPQVRETISVSYGVFGGRRTRERETVHYAATVDDLIIRASRLCLQMKQRRGMLATLQLPLFGGEMEERVEPRVQVTSVSFVARGREAEASVELRVGDRQVLRQVSGEAKQPPEALLIQAARDALVALLPGFGAIQIHQVSRQPMELQEKEERVETIQVLVELQTNSSSLLLSGSAVVRENVYRAAVNALLHALNRPLAKWLSQARLNSAM